jgi:hypothetical protein
MSLALILAAALAPGPAMTPAVVPAQPVYQVDRSLGDSDRLNALDRAVRSAYAGGRIDRATATELHLGIGRTRRQMFRMGMQVGYRQRVRLRERIDRLYERLEQRQAARAADLRSGN